MILLNGCRQRESQDLSHCQSASAVHLDSSITVCICVWVGGIVLKLHVSIHILFWLLYQTVSDAGAAIFLIV